MLPVQVSDGFLQKIFELDHEATLTVDLEKQTITIDQSGSSESFDINPYKRTCLLNGYDDIDYLLTLKHDIEDFEIEKAFN